MSEPNTYRYCEGIRTWFERSSLILNVVIALELCLVPGMQYHLLGWSLRRLNCTTLMLGSFFLKRTSNSRLTEFEH